MPREQRIWPSMSSKLSGPIALICVPLGFVLPLVVGLKGPEVWPLAIGIWLAGMVVSVAGKPKGSKLSGGRLFTLWANAVLVVFFFVLTLVAGGVTVH
jgi:hypothetical protein